MVTPGWICRSGSMLLTASTCGRVYHHVAEPGPLALPRRGKHTAPPPSLLDRCLNRVSSRLTLPERTQASTPSSSPHDRPSPCRSRMCGAVAAAAAGSCCTLPPAGCMVWRPTGPGTGLSRSAPAVCTTGTWLARPRRCCRSRLRLVSPSTHPLRRSLTASIVAGALIGGMLVGSGGQRVGGGVDGGWELPTGEPRASASGCGQRGWVGPHQRLSSRRMGLRETVFAYQPAAAAAAATLVVLT